MSLKKFLIGAAVSALLPWAANAAVVSSSYGHDIKNSFGHEVMNSGSQMNNNNMMRHMCSDMMYSKNIYFKFGQSSLSEKDKHDIKSILDILDKDCLVEVVGHTDYTGSDEVNKKVSLKRANMVADVLVEMGVMRDMISTKGVGYHDLAVNTAKDVAEIKNRRVMISYHY